ncbi:hypothetical protein WDV93_15080 [Pantoea ananatis]
MLPLKIFSLCFLTVILLSLAASLAQATHGGITLPAVVVGNGPKDSAGVAPDPQANASQAIVQSMPHRQTAGKALSRCTRGLSLNVVVKAAGTLG